MKAITEENVIETLKNVIDPDLKHDIVSLGFVKNLKIIDNNISFELQLTTPACPLRNQFVKECEKVIRANIKDVNKIGITLTSNVQKNISSTDKKNLLPNVKNTLAIASGKGGVGKSTIAVNIAVALAKDGARVGLLDADVYGPSAPLMFGINEKPKIINNKLQPLEKFGVKIMSIGFLIDPMDAVIWRGPLASGAIKQFMSDVDWGKLDYLIFDLPPGTGDVQLTLVQTIPLSGAVIVTTPQEVALSDARKGLVMFNKVNVPVLGIVENMSYFICSKCGNRENIFDSGGGAKISRELNVPFLGEIPIDANIRIGSDEGNPVVYQDPDSVLTKNIQEVARKLAAQISVQYFNKSEK